MYRHRRRLIAAALVCALPLLFTGRPAQTQTIVKEKPHPIDAFLDTCTAKNPSTGGETACIGKAEAMWDKQMNKDYQKLLVLSDAKTQTQIRNAQRTWVAYRNNEWAAQSGVYNHKQGSMWAVMEAGHHMRVVKERALLLGDYLAE